MQDLLRGIEKILPLKKEEKKETVILQTGNGNVDALLKRGHMALEDRDWGKAQEYFNQALNINAECAEAYLGLAMAAAKCNEWSAYCNYCVEHISAYSQDRNLEKSRKFADKNLQEQFNQLDLRVNEQRESINRARQEHIRKIGPACGFLVSGDTHIVALRLDGTVAATGLNCQGQCNVSSWKDIVALSAAWNTTAGIKADGTVLMTGDNTSGQCNVSDWQDIVAIASGTAHTVGLKSDGFVVATGNNVDGQCNVSSWRDIVAVAAGLKYTVGLKSDGTVIATSTGTQFGGCNVSDWADIVDIAACDNTTVGVKSDGSVIAAGDYIYYLDNPDDISGWKDIVKVAVGRAHIVGLKINGTVVTAGDNINGQCDVSNWKDIVAISAGNFHTAGLRANGSIVLTAMSERFLSIDKHWLNERLFNNIETLEEDRVKAIQHREEQCRVEQESLDTEAKAKKDKLLSEQDSLYAELPTLKGLFAGKRRKEIERRLEEIEQELQGLK
jgi:hypothetical protein